MKKISIFAQIVMIAFMFIITADAAPIIQPSADSPQVSGIAFWVDVEIKDADELFGVSFKLCYDTSILNVVTPYQENIALGSFLGPEPVWTYKVKEDKGVVAIGISRKAGMEGVSGTGEVVRVKFIPEVGRDLKTTFELRDVLADDVSGSLITITDVELVIDISSLNKGIVSLDGITQGPPTWKYKLRWLSGNITEWTYTGAAITDATVASGSSAENAGWSVKTQSDTTVTFETITPMTSDEVSGFEITGDAGGVGNWTCHDSSAPIDGSLPVVLSSFTALSFDKDIIISWRTESEIENTGFNIYRSSTRDGKFVKINPEMIKGAGISAKSRDYKFVDEKAFDGDTFYYIESVAFDGKRSRSDVIRVPLLSPRGKIKTLWGRLKTAD